MKNTVHSLNLDSVIYDDDVDILRQMIEERVKVRLRARMLNEFIRDKDLPRGKYFLAVTGPGLQLGFDDYDKAPRMSITGQDSTVWMKDLWIVKNTVLRYKYIVVHRYTNKVLHYETITEREIDVRTQPLVIDDKYNTVTFPGHDKHTKQINTRPNAYGMNNKTNDIIKTTGSQEKENTKVVVKEYKHSTEQHLTKQHQEHYRDQARNDRRDVTISTNEVHKMIKPASNASSEKEKKVESNGYQATKSSQYQVDETVKNNTMYSDEF